jgi:small-conductance mechanosensitive channel
MADNFGLKIGIEGEREFKNALREINQDFKVLGSEMNLVTSQFDKQDKSLQAVTARNEVLNKEIDAQKEKVTTLEAALKNAAESFGENDKRTKAWQIQLNNANADLNKMEKELEDSAVEAENLGEQLEESGKSAEGAGGKFEKFGGVLKGIGVAMGSVALAAGAATIKLGTEIVQQFGELEQNLGGSEAVFGKYASSIQKTGEEAYKNLGVSQSQYLATANKMGALFQGSGVEQQKSLELTEKAMQRAADMASVMGIDMQVALDSVAGAAKGNFTMMDNLGVAMNATNIEAYALAKGLDFTWASATNAEKAEVAMQMFFENTEQYAGNFARESTQTVTGSIGLLQAALGSFTAGLGNADADMTNITQNLVDAFQSVVINIVPILENVVTALPTAMDARSSDTFHLPSWHETQWLLVILHLHFLKPLRCCCQSCTQ